MDYFKMPCCWVLNNTNNSSTYNTRTVYNIKECLKFKDQKKDYHHCPPDYRRMCTDQLLIQQNSKLYAAIETCTYHDRLATLQEIGTLPCNILKTALWSVIWCTSWPTREKSVVNIIREETTPLLTKCTIWIMTYTSQSGLKGRVLSAHNWKVERAYKN